MPREIVSSEDVCGGEPRIAGSSSRELHVSFFDGRSGQFEPVTNYDRLAARRAESPSSGIGGQGQRAFWIGQAAGKNFFRWGQ